MAKFKFYGALLIIIILLDFVSVCATNGSKSKAPSSGTPVTTNPKAGGGDGGGGNGSGTSPATPSAGGGGAPKTSPGGGGGGGGGPSTPPAEGGGGGGGDGGKAAPGGGGGGDGNPAGGKTAPGGGGGGGDGNPAGGKTAPGGGGGGDGNPAGGKTAPGGGGGENATVLAYALFSKTPSTTTAQVNGLISMFQPPNGNTVISGQIGALFNKIDGNYRFTIRDGTVIVYDLTGLVNPIFIGSASLFSFTWSAMKLTGATTAIGKTFVIEEYGKVLASGMIEEEFRA